MSRTQIHSAEAADVQYSLVALERRLILALSCDNLPVDRVVIAGGGLHLSSFMRALAFIAVVSIASNQASPSVLSKEKNETVDSFKARCHKAKGRFSVSKIGDRLLYVCIDAGTGPLCEAEDESKEWPWYFDRDPSACARARGF